ncbi:L-aminoadipate-semialdehyde dehydrogenase-phosphopantetheinyl transferase [Glycine soja]
MGSGHIKVGPTSLSLLRSLPPSFPLALLDYQDYDKFGLRFPNFNFNVSHHDIVSYDVPLGETITEFIQFFSSYFSSLEWDNIVNSGTSNDVLTEFYRNQSWDVRGAEALGNLHQWAKKKQYRHWSLKEAYVKPIGSGLTEGLNKVEFSHTRWTNISAKGWEGYDRVEILVSSESLPNISCYELQNNIEESGLY